MKKIRLGFTIITLGLLFTLTGCTTDQETNDFIKECNRKPGCTYKVLSGECVCDKTHDYIQRP